MNNAQLQAEARFERLDQLPLTPYREEENAWTGLIGAFKAVFARRELLGLLVRRELVGRYKDSALGLVWSLVRPITQLLIYYLVMGQFLGAARNINNFAVFIFAGLTIYGLFSEMVSTMTSSIVANSGLIKKVFLPREIFPIAAIGAAMFNFALQLLILVLAALLVGTLSFGPQLLFAIGAFLVIVIWATGAGLILAAANVFMRDVQFLVEVIMMLLMWFSPIVYSWTFVRDVFQGAGFGWLTQVYVSNPVTLGVLGFQEAFWAGASGGETLPQLGLRMVIAIVIGLGLVWFGQRYFAKRQANFAQEL